MVYGTSPQLQLGLSKVTVVPPMELSLCEGWLQLCLSCPSNEQGTLSKPEQHIQVTGQAWQDQHGKPSPSASFLKFLDGRRYVLVDPIKQLLGVFDADQDSSAPLALLYLPEMDV